MRGENGTESLVVFCLNIYLHDSSLGVCFLLIRMGKQNVKIIVK